MTDRFFEVYQDWLKLYEEICTAAGFDTIECTLNKGIKIAAFRDALKFPLFTKVRQTGRVALSAFSNIPDDKIDDKVCTAAENILVITAPFDAANFVQPILSGDRFAKLDQIKNWGEVIVVLQAANDKCNLSALHRLTSFAKDVYHLKAIRFAAREFGAIGKFSTPEEREKHLQENGGFNTKQVDRMIGFIDKIEIKKFEFKPVSEEALQAQENWQRGYMDWSGKWDQFRNDKTLSEIFGVKDQPRPVTGMKFAKYVNSVQALKDYDHPMHKKLFELIAATIRQLALLSQFPENDRDYLNQQGCAEAGNIVSCCAPLWALDEKTGNMKVDNWRDVYKILFNDPRAIWIFKDYTIDKEHRDPYSERDMDLIIEEIRQVENLLIEDGISTGIDENDPFAKLFLVPLA